MLFLLYSAEQEPAAMERGLSDSFGSHFGERSLPPSPLIPRAQRPLRKDEFARGSVDDIERVAQVVAESQQKLLYAKLVQAVMHVGFVVRHIPAIHQLLWRFAETYYQSSEIIGSILSQLPSNFREAHKLLREEAFVGIDGKNLWPDGMAEPANLLLKKKILDLLLAVCVHSPGLPPLRNGAAMPALTMPPAR